MLVPDDFTSEKDFDKFVEKVHPQETGVIFGTSRSRI